MRVVVLLLLGVWLGVCLLAVALCVMAKEGDQAGEASATPPVRIGGTRFVRPRSPQLN